MLLKRIMLGALGCSFGLMTAGGVFTVLLAVGLIPRFAGKTHTANRVMLYETMVILGTLTGDLLSVFEPYTHLGTLAMGAGVPEALWRAAGEVILLCYGMFSGIFIGSLAMAIAEMLDSIPILTRRVSFRHGLGLAIISMAAGKICGSLLYFFTELHRTA